MAGKSPYNTVLKCAGVKVGNVTDIDGPSIEAEDIDVTDLDSADQFREYVRGQVDGGTVTLAVNLDPGSAVHMTTLLEGMSASDPEDATKAWTIENTINELSLDFNGYVKSWSPKASKGNALSVSVAIKVTGKPSFLP